MSQPNDEYRTPDDFPLRELIEEVDTIITEKTDFVELNVRKGRMSPEFANLARYRVARLRCLSRLLKKMPAKPEPERIVAGPEKDEPEPEPAIEQAQEPKPEKPAADDFDPFADVDDF